MSTQQLLDHVIDTIIDNSMEARKDAEAEGVDPVKIKECEAEIDRLIIHIRTFK